MAHADHLPAVAISGDVKDDKVVWRRLFFGGGDVDMFIDLR